MEGSGPVKLVSSGHRNLAVPLMLFVLVGIISRTKELLLLIVRRSCYDRGRYRWLVFEKSKWLWW